MLKKCLSPKKMDGAVKIWHMGIERMDYFVLVLVTDKNSIAADTFGDFSNNIGK